MTSRGDRFLCGQCSKSGEYGESDVAPFATSGDAGRNQLFLVGAKRRARQNRASAVWRPLQYRAIPESDVRRLFVPGAESVAPFATSGDAG